MVLQLRSHSDEATVVETEKTVWILCFSEFIIIFCRTIKSVCFYIYVVSMSSDGTSVAGAMHEGLAQSHML